ncbi:biotin transporter BioY [Geobacillus sp. C56-T2]|uniref:biotin transporter BioY n=1 Tax=Geobacillus sp. C56-T2 TaxID=600773 RepID=UPI0011A20002|nr:biotin transporter BioY [Geobacillus sp. C56-T2]NNV07558.1 biotin transporter BioY [Geobacillus sp. MMMUD3]TWG31767.1 biotin transport system substrate-specific component [Geobacillus sp. C56-T2]
MHIRSWIWAALFAALTAVGGMIKIPVPYVPFTLQIAAVYLAACLLGPKIGALSQLLYVLVGLAGAPVFAEGGGLGYIWKPTFGYLLGFIAGAYTSGWLIERFRWTKGGQLFAANLAALVVVYLCGCLWLYGAMKWIVEKPLTIGQTIWFGVLLPIPGDLILCAACSLVAARVWPRVRPVMTTERLGG